MSDVEIRRSVLPKACPCCRDPKKRLKARQSFSLRVSSNVDRHSRHNNHRSWNRSSIDLHISLAAVCSYELHLGLWLSLYRHSVGSLKSMCSDELAMSGAIHYCLCLWHFACGLMSSKQEHHWPLCASAAAVLSICIVGRVLEESQKMSQDGDIIGLVFVN